jgi:hypothetical protein
MAPSEPSSLIRNHRRSIGTVVTLHTMAAETVEAGSPTAHYRSQQREASALKSIAEECLRRETVTRFSRDRSHAVTP